MEIRPIDPADRSRIDEFIMSRWFTMKMVVRGESVDLGSADGFYACDGDGITGLITFRFSGNEMEILSLDSVPENRGTGTALLDAAVMRAKESGAGRVVLITTNDNLAALRVYQKRGFDMAHLYRNAVDRARQIKPEIPLTGMGGIPLKHEIELEMTL